MHTPRTFPSFRLDVAYYADFGYAKMVVASAAVGLILALRHPGQGLAPDAGVGALAFFAICIFLTRWVEQRRLSEYHATLVLAMPWNACGQAILHGIVDNGQPLRHCHLRYIAEAHMRQLERAGAEPIAAEASIFGRSLGMRYPND